jgi:hypothetical protein
MIESGLNKINGEFTRRMSVESENDSRLEQIAKERVAKGGFGAQWNYHNSVFLKRQVLSRLIYQDFLYQKILSVPGVICEFGVHWGATLATMMNLRGMYEPYNHSRTIHGFDTFAGFPAVSQEDGGFSEAGDYASSARYEDELSQILDIHESFSPISHLKKYELVVGDVAETLPVWLNANPHAIISMAVFDMDIYKPTKEALQLVLPRLTKGSLLVFDELNCPHFPGETVAVQEILGLNNLRLQRFPHQPYCAYAEFGA